MAGDSSDLSHVPLVSGAARVCPGCSGALAADARFCGGCGHALVDTETSPPPSVKKDVMLGREITGRYRLIERLGQGGMGAVYKAVQISLKRTVAVKVLRTELSEDPGLVKRFNAEAEMAAKLSHPNTVTLFDFGQDTDGTLFIVMEHVEGRSLRNLVVKEGPLDPVLALEICEQICLSLADAHAHGIIHRDLKPDNVMLSKRGNKTNVARVLDFGIAKLRDERGDITAMPMTQAGDMLGTPQYMAPEQIRGERVDGRTDVYALGAVLYEMVSGRLPFEGGTIMSILGKHLTDAPLPPSQRRPDLHIPAEIDRLVMQALFKQPEGRVPSMEAFGERVRGLLAVLGAANTPAPVLSPRRTTRPPGVPLTVDTPGMARAAAPVVPVAPAPRVAPVVPVTPMSPPGPMGQGAYGAHGATPDPIQVPHGRRGPGSALWVPLGIAAAAVITILIVLSTRSDNSTDEIGLADQAAGKMAEAETPEVPTEIGEAAPGTLWRHPTAGYGMIVPPGFVEQVSPNPSLAFFVKPTIGGQLVVGVSGEQVGGELTASIIQRAAKNLIMVSNGREVSRTFEIFQGVSRFTFIYDIDTLGTRWQVVFYGANGMLIAVAVGSPKPIFDTTAELRRSVFEDRLKLP